MPSPYQPSPYQPAPEETEAMNRRLLEQDLLLRIQQNMAAWMATESASSNKQGMEVR